MLVNKVKRLDQHVNYPLRRPKGDARFFTSKNFVVKDKNGDKLSPKSHSWLVKKYIELYGFPMTKQKMRDGMMREIKEYELSKTSSVMFKNDEHKK